MKRRSTPFTLIELLVVIGIIAILAGILLPTISIAIRKANVAKAKSEMSSLITAISMYQSEYDVMPFHNVSMDSRSLNDTEYDALIAFLSQTGTAANMARGNHRKIKILNVQKPGLYNDPWGRRYIVILDTDYDGNVLIANADGLVHSDATIPRPILIYSEGPDGKRKTPPPAANTWHDDNKDNVYSIETVWANGQGHVIQ